MTEREARRDYLKLRYIAVRGLMNTTEFTFSEANAEVSRLIESVRVGIPVSLSKQGYTVQYDPNVLKWGVRQNTYGPFLSHWYFRSDAVSARRTKVNGWPIK